MARFRLAGDRVYAGFLPWNISYGFFCWPNPARYVFSFWGFIDLATILPFYVIMLWPEIGVEYLFAWRAMRVIRVLRILKLLRLMPALNSLWGAIVNSRHQLILFYVFISIVMIVAGAADVRYRRAGKWLYHAQYLGLLGDSHGDDGRLWRYYAAYTRG
ncbi:Ion transport protein [Kluyvera cryocrescens]|uniref:Ion transport protein n=1 Tax=Kluyvera cryocrescens TaxID=580 RepID=A0A485BPG0_KLUCR|nr:Ion transport protein [Kluyvera cryocrescens]